MYQYNSVLQRYHLRLHWTPLLWRLGYNPTLLGWRSVQRGHDWRWKELEWSASKRV